MKYISIPNFIADKAIVNIEDYSNLLPETDIEETHLKPTISILENVKINSSYFIPENIILLKDTKDTIVILNIKTLKYKFIDKEDKRCSLNVLLEFAKDSNNE